MSYPLVNFTGNLESLTSAIPQLPRVLGPLADSAYLTRLLNNPIAGLTR
jgi:hypothetical protein